MYFLKKNSNTLPFHLKYDHKIIFLEEQKHNHTPFYKMSSQKLDKIKCYLYSHHAKRFIQVTSVSFLSVILFVKKLHRKIRFYVNYRRLNAITKKDR